MINISRNNYISQHISLVGHIYLVRSNETALIKKECPYIAWLPAKHSVWQLAHQQQGSPPHHKRKVAMKRIYLAFMCKESTNERYLSLCTTSVVFAFICWSSVNESWSKLVLEVHLLKGNLSFFVVPYMTRNPWAKTKHKSLLVIVCPVMFKLWYDIILSFISSIIYMCQFQLI